MGTPISPVTLDPVAFVLGKASVSETALAPEQRREILVEVLQRIKPHLKYLPQLNVFLTGAKEAALLPPDMPKKTRCLALWNSYSQDQEQHLFITGKGRLFWHTVKPSVKMGGGEPQPMFGGVSWLDSDGVLDLAKCPRVVRGIICGLHRVADETVGIRRARLSGTGLPLQRRQERLASVERLHGYLGGILSRMT